MEQMATRRDVVAIAFGLLFVVACTSRRNVKQTPTADWDSAAVALNQTPISATVVAAGPQPSGSAYLVLSTAQAPYLHRFVRVPAACMLTPIDCPPPDVITAYPQEGVTPSHLYWAPNGREALFLDTYQPRVLRFDPSDASLTTLLDNVPTMRDDLAWLPDGRLVFVIQSAGEYASQLVALKWADGAPKLETLATFDGIAYLLGLDDAGHVLISLDIYGFPEGKPSLKKDTVKIQLLAVDPATGGVTELWGQVDWLSKRPQSALPDGSQLIVESSSVSLWNLQTGVETSIGSYVIWPTGSPDKRWLAIVATDDPGGDDFTTRVIEIKTGQTRDLAQLPVGSKLFWSPDSRYLVMARLGLETSASLGSLRVAAVDSSLVMTPQLDLGEYPVVEDVSWGP